MPFIKIRNNQLFYDFISPHLLIKGKPLLIFLHEGLGCSEQWKDFHTGLANTLNLPGFYYDRYGYGKSQEISETRNVDFLEEEAEIVLPELLEKLNLKKIPKILFGHSDGGTIALLYAAKSPVETKAVITEAAHVIAEEITSKGHREILEIYKTTGLKQKLSKYHGSKTGSMFSSWINVWMSDGMRNWSIEHKLSEIACPVLAIQGTDDNYGSPEQLTGIKMHASKANVNTILIPGCGHIPHHQARKEVERLTADFVKNL